MANINQTISLGIGAPSGIPPFLTFGLVIQEETALVVPGLEYTMGDNRAHYGLPVNRLHYTMPEED